MALEQLPRPAGPIVHRQQQRTVCLCGERDESDGRGCGGERHDILVRRWGRVLGVQRPQGKAVPIPKVVAGGRSGCGVQVRGHPKRGGISAGVG